MTETLARLHVRLADTDPVIWRRIDVPVEATLKMLHDSIQAAMGWLDYHLWEFEAGDRRYGVPDPEWPEQGLYAARTAKLATLLDRGLRSFDYVYDMGDQWHHVVTVENVRSGEPGVKYPRYIEGQHRVPPEDCGGAPGFEHFLDAIATPDHPDHAEMVAWHRECYGTDFTPDTIDEAGIRWRMGQIAKRRAAGKTSQLGRGRGRRVFTTVACAGQDGAARRREPPPGRPLSPRTRSARAAARGETRRPRRSP